MNRGAIVLRLHPLNLIWVIPAKEVLLKLIVLAINLSSWIFVELNRFQLT